MREKYIFVVCSLFVGLTSAVPIKFVPDDDGGDMITNMFTDIRSMISGLNVGIRRLNETKKPEPSFETEDSFVYPHDKMRRLIEKKMLGAENVTGVTTTPTPTPSVAEEKKEKVADSHIEGEKMSVVKRDEIGCTDKADCNKTAYCNKMSYTCETCHKDGGKCSTDDECCLGYSCDEDSNKCKKKKGISGQSCMSRSDCGEDFCCALNDNGDGVCQPYLTEGEECGNDDPFTTFFAAQSLFVRDATGLPNKCPCNRNLKCVKKSSLLFMESQVCSKKEEKKQSDHKALIKITFKSSPILKFHSEGDMMDDFPLPSFFPKELTSSSSRPPRVHRHGFTMRFTTRKDKDKKEESNISLRKSPFSFFRFMNPFDDQEVDDIKDDLKKKREVKRERRKLVNEVGEEARESVHRAVDGIFDTILKKISFGGKFRE